MARRLRNFVLFVALIFVLPASWAAENESSSYKIAVLAYKGKVAAQERWTSHAEYLNQKLAPLRFEIVPLSYADNELTEAVVRREVDFVITNPGHYAELEMGGHVSHLSTRRVAGPSGILDRFGGTVISLPQRTDINRYADLENKQVLIPSQSSLGGWQVHLREALAQGVDLRSDAEIVELTDHKKVVEAILAGKGDAGLIRSDLIEDLIASGELSREQIKLVNPRTEPGYPYLLSTRLYPEWPFAAVSGTPRELGAQVLQALLGISPADSTATSAGIYGWTIPGHYNSLNDLFRETGLGPYANQHLSLGVVLKRYWQELLMLSALLIVTLFASSCWVIRANQILRHEVQERKRAEHRVRMLSQAVEQSPVSVVLTDTEGRIEYVNPIFEQITGYGSAEVIGQHSRILKAEQVPKNYFGELWQAIREGRTWRGEFQNRKKNGELFWEQANITPVQDEDGVIRHYLAVKEDITLRKQQEEQIVHQAHYDALTDLPNRFLSLDRLSQLLVEAQRNAESVAVLFLDLDDFKKVNDTMGHDTGDALLIEAAQRLQRAIRSGDTVGRLGGDEFIVLLGGLENAVAASPVVETLLKHFREPFKIDSRELVLTASVGIAAYPEDGTTPSELLRNADSAMYHAKGRGRNTYAYFTAAMNREVTRRLLLEEQMHGALDRGEFSLRYQPQVDVKTGRMVGVEALLRWHNPALGEVHPEEFIPIAEQTGLIMPIGKFVLTEASAMIKVQRQSQNDGFTIAVNLSPRQFRDPGLVACVEEVVNQAGVARDAIKLEITEGVLMSGSAHVDRSLTALNELGVGIVMDDFGTGYSSLSYLRNYPFDTLKIDQSFISDMTVDRADRELVSAAIAMAHGLGLKVVAEGVETEEQLAMLAEQGCEYAQGFLFSEPKTLEQIEEMLAVECCA